MTETRALVLDANILIGAVLGMKVSSVLETYHDHIEFFAPDVAFADAYRHVPGQLERRGMGMDRGIRRLEMLESVINRVPLEKYEPMRDEALARIARRDPDDWPVLAVALVLNCPIWTQDQDFFGTGVATWTTDRVGLFLRNRPALSSQDNAD